MKKTFPFSIFSFQFSILHFQFPKYTSISVLSSKGSSCTSVVMAGTNITSPLLSSGCHVHHLQSCVQM